MHVFLLMVRPTSVAILRFPVGPVRRGFNDDRGKAGHADKLRIRGSADHGPGGDEYGAIEGFNPETVQYATRVQLVFDQGEWLIQPS